MRIIYEDEAVIVCIKPAGVLSTDEPGGVPELLREQLHCGKKKIRTVHRLDRVVSGLMVLGRTAETASLLSEQIRAGNFRKEYLAVIHGTLPEKNGTLRDLLLRNKQERKTYVVREPGKGVQEAILEYRILGEKDGLSLVKIQLKTGRTHQIRAQFSARGFPLVGDRKYGGSEDDCRIALWSHKIGFCHPVTGRQMDFTEEPDTGYPWDLFGKEQNHATL